MTGNKRKRISGGLAATAMAGLAACQTPQAAATAPDTAADTAAIEAVLDQLETAWAAGDGPGFAAPFAADADFATWFGLRVTGAQAVAGGHTAIFNGIYKGTGARFELAGWRLLTPDVALVKVDGWVTPPGAEPEGPAEVHPLLVLKRAGEGWEIAAFQNTPVLNPAATGGDIRKMK